MSPAQTTGDHDSRPWREENSTSLRFGEKGDRYPSSPPASEKLFDANRKYSIAAWTSSSGAAPIAMLSRVM